jgi:hypothetical protein
MIIHSRKLTVFDRDAGGPITPELAAAGRALSPVKQLPAAHRALPLGDVVEIYAKPVARAIDRATAKLPQRMRTALTWCGACSKRQTKLNNLVGDVRSLAAWKRALKKLPSSFKRR